MLPKCLLMNVFFPPYLAPQLYVPSQPIFPNVTEGKHVVYIDFGYQGTRDLAKQFTITSMKPIFYILIPLVSDSPNGLPHYNLPLANFILPAHRNEDMIGTTLFPFQEADALIICDSSVHLRHQGEEIKVEYSVSEPCTKPPQLLSDEFQELVLEGALLGSHSGNVFFCNSRPYSTQASSYCNLMDGIRHDVECAYPDVCTVYKSEDERACTASFQITKITEGFREMLLLGDNPINIVSSEMFGGNYTIDIKYPCVGQV